MQGSATHHIEMNPLVRASLDESTHRLAHQFHGVFSEATVSRALNDSWDSLAARATIISPFLPVMVERFAREQLQASAQASGLILKHAPEILFVCQRNAGRSQMAAAIAHQLGRERVGVRSAGSAAGEFVQPEVISAMAEIGLDLTMEFPKPLTDVVIRAADVVITMGCGEACPVYPGKRYEDWEVADPAGQPIESVRAIRDEMRGRIESLLERVAPD